MENKKEFETENAQVDNIEDDTTQDYISAIKEMKKNSVSKEEYEKLKQENRNLLQTLVEGGSIEAVQEKPPVDIKALRKELFQENSGLDNLTYITKTLELRDALIESGEPDPFLPMSSKATPTDEEVRTAEKVAEAFRSCIEYAEGDSQIFTQELMRITADINPIAGRNSRRR